MGTESRWVVRLARTAFVLVLAIVGSSAFIRLSAGTPDAVPSVVDGARMAHRLSASLAGILVLLVAGLVFTRDRSRRPDFALAGVTLVVTLALAWVGRYSGPEATNAVLVANLAGGLALSTLLWALAARESAGVAQGSSSDVMALALVTLVAAGLQSITGAMTVTGFAKLGAAHHASGIVAIALCVWLAIRLGRSPATRRVGQSIIALAAFQASLGVAALVFSLPLWLVLAHNIGAALLLAALAQGIVQCRSRAL